ncbi:MAG: hypothetical protein NC117_10495 [Pseudoflavonifractor sp.]|nr:hypothetical protein [Pseudoflavonifractor sp.]
MQGNGWYGVPLHHTEAILITIIRLSEAYAMGECPPRTEVRGFLIIGVPLVRHPSHLACDGMGRAVRTSPEGVSASERR